MTRQDVFDWVKKEYGTEPEYLWEDSPGYAVLRHGENRKWYGVILNVPGGRLELPTDGEVDLLNLKCDPILAGPLRLREEYVRPYHMNKSAWIGVLLDRVTDENEVFDLIRFSFELTAKKPRGRKR